VYNSEDAVETGDVKIFGVCLILQYDRGILDSV
jgi:hypothetical protein